MATGTYAPNALIPFHGLAQGALNGPLSPHQAQPQGAHRPAAFTRPLGNVFGLALVSDWTIPARVVRLGAWRGPSAVAWFVVSVIVPAIQCQARRALTHVSKERREVMTPTVAHGNTACAIRGEFRCVGVIAPALRVLPTSVLACATPAVNVSHRSNNCNGVSA